MVCALFLSCGSLCHTWYAALSITTTALTRAATPRARAFNRARLVRTLIAAVIKPNAWLAFGGCLQGESGARVVGMRGVAAATHAPMDTRATQTSTHMAQLFARAAGELAPRAAGELAPLRSCPAPVPCARKVGGTSPNGANEAPRTNGPAPASADIPRDEISPRGAFVAARARLTPPRRFHDDCRSRSFSRSSLRTRPKRFRAA